MVGMIVVNIFMYLQGRLFIKGFANITKVPSQILVPAIITLCMIGGYAIKYNNFNCILMVVIGIFGYYMRKLDFPLTPMVIGLILGSLCEKNMRRALALSGGNWMTFVQKPISCVFLVLAVVMLFFPVVRNHFANKKKNRS